MFSIDPTIPIKYQDMKTKAFLNLNQVSSSPFKTLSNLRVTKVGVYPVYEAGGSLRCNLHQ